MKKETRKRVFNFALSGAIVASVATPLAIVLGKESNLFLNKNTKQIRSNNQFIGSSYIDGNDYSLNLNNALGNVNNSNRVISVGTPNIVKSIPQGYIVVSGNSNNNKNQQVVCLDKNDPTQELWQLDLGNNNSNENINIYGVEYTPYGGGKLIVLYSETASDNTYSNQKNVQIKFKVFNNLNSNNPQVDFAGSGWSYKNDWSSSTNQQTGGDTGARLDTWAINPIFNFRGEATKYLIYCKEQYFTNNDNNGRTRFYLVDLKTPANNNDKCEAIKMRWEKVGNDAAYNGNKKIILSIASVEKDNQVYMIPLIVDFVEKKLEIGIYKLTNNNNNFEFVQLENKEHIKFDSINVNENIFDNQNSSNTWLANKAADLVKGSISSSTFKIEDNKLKIAFAINMSPNGTGTSPHRGGKLITLEIGNNFNNISTQIKQLFQNTNNVNSEEEIWHGYFANEVIIKHGINSTINNNNDLTPFISIGWSKQKFLKQNPWFVGVIKNPFSTTNYNFNTNTTENPQEFRVYRVNGGNNYDSQNGIYSGAFSGEKQFGYNQFNIGMPILEYNDEETNNNVFERNILFTWNNRQKAIVINQKNRQDTINGSPIYGYHTRINTEINSDGYHKFDKSIFSLSSNDMNQVTIETIQTSILDKIKREYLKNVVGNNVSIVQDSIKFNFPEGRIEFKINVGNKWFDENGILQTTDKVFNIAIEGFDRKTTNLTNTNIKLYGSGSGNYNNGLGRSAYMFIPTQVASYNVNSSLEDTKRFFTIIFKELVLNNFQKQPNNFRNLSSFSANTTTDQINLEFKNIFPKFEWIEANNEEGTIKVRLGINKKYVYTNETNYEIDITFSGLRKIKKTELKNVESSSPLDLKLSNYNIPNDGNSLSGNTYPNVQLLTEDILKQNIINEINKEYSGINQNNGLDSGEGTLTRHLPFTQKFIDQNGQLDVGTSRKLSKEHIKLSNFDFFAGYGVLKLDVKLLVWNEGGAHGQLKNTITVDLQQPNAPESDAPSATWYISGFRKDNVVTKFNPVNPDAVWALKGLEVIATNEFGQYRETVEKSLSDYLKANPDLIDFPYWVNNKDEILNNIQVDFDSTDIEIDPQNPKVATLKVRLKDNMWESNDQGKVVDKKTSATYQSIKISGFLNPTPIALNSEHLKNIKVSGNTKNITITEEEKAFESVEEESKKFLEIQYSVEGLDQWFNKAEFITKLDQLSGYLNDENWIIKREDIQARYALKKEYDNGKIIISVDGVNVNNNASQQQKISIIDDTHNQGVKGYINIDKITDKFKAENFEVRGTDKNPKLIIKNVEELNTLFSRYSSDNIFEILYSDQANATSFDPSKVIWKTGNLSASVNLTGTFTDKFSLSFRGTSNYEVYSNGTKQDNGYILTTPAIKMIISIEIDNPFKDKYVKFNFKKNEQDTTTDQYFYQNEGGFSVKIGTSQDSNDFKGFSDFINSLSSSLDQVKRESLELAYFVSDHELTEEQLKQSLEDSFLYEESVDSRQKYNVWKVLDTTKPEKNLGLLVNDYVIVTVRVKKEKLASEEKSGYKINYADNYIPFQSRVYGYKIKANKIQIDKKSIQLVNVGQAESAPYALDGYARLKHLSLVEDPNKNYLGAAIKINYFNDFYKDQAGKILTSGSGQVLVKRENGTSSKEYKDQAGKPIKDVDGSNILLQLNQKGTPTNPTKGTTSTELVLSQYSLNAFKFPELEKTELKYNFFQNQTIEFEFVNKKGLATGTDEYDYYIDQPNVKVEYTFNNIKFPISNEQNISYEFNAQEFVEKISNPINRDDVYKNSLDSNEPPINGQSKLVETFKVIRRENNQKETTLSTLEEINKQIKTDFNGQVKLVATYTSTDGQIKQIDGGDIFSIETLKNGDRFKIEIVSSSDELIFAQLPNPLIFVVSGLFEKDIEQELLKHLRVKQGGVIDGQGSFNILVDDPNQSNSNSDLKTSLGGYKFLVRVWNENKQIKHEWTENFISINDLNNGDKVEWKLVSPNGSPVKEAYYNTIANPTKHNAAEDKYSFIKVNQEGFAGKNISEPQEGIGQNPEQLNAYPEDSGLLISGLKSRDDSSYTTIDDSEFRRVMNLMNFSYAGINGSGNMISSTSASDIKLNVVGRSSDEFTLDYLIKNGYVTFYYNNESLSQMNSFNWNQVKDENGNWLTSPGTLSNGDSVAIRYKDPIHEHWYYAPVVSGLQNKSDGMSMLSWVGMGAAAFVTLGIFVFIYLYVRNKKLK